MSRRTIAVDIDDVIAESTEALRRLVNKRTGKDLTEEHYKVDGDYWGYYEQIWHEHDIDIDFNELEGMMSVDQSHIGLTAGAQFVISELAAEYTIVLITSRQSEWRAATEEWLRIHFPDLNLDIHFAKSAQDSSKKSKGELCRELGAEWLVDDNPEHCQSAIDESVMAVLFGEYGWHHKGVPEQVIKCIDWPEVLEYFNGVGR